MNLEEDIEPFLIKDVCLLYWNVGSDHAEFRAIINAIDIGGGQTCDVPRVLLELYRAGFVIRKL